MKVLVIKTESVIPRKVLLEAQKEIEKCAASGILLLDGRYTYEVVDIDMSMLDVLVNPGVEKEPSFDFDSMSENCPDNRVGRFFAYCHHDDNFGVMCNEETCPLLKEK